MELKHLTWLSLATYVFLLIVPYGIETEAGAMYKNDPSAFNRTLWN